MTALLDNPRFASAYAELAQIGLNPRRHTAPDARAHSELVAQTAGRLARENGCDAGEIALLEDLGRAHDIGKLTGTAKPERSLALLEEWFADGGELDPRLPDLVKWHDTNLPWWTSTQRGQPPSDKAWRRLASKVDMRLLCLFMVADRIDAPGGWRRNAPALWFIEQARARGLVGELRLDLPDVPSEVCAGAALVVDDRVLVIRVRASGWELPKGGLEFDETAHEAALRELREEAGIEGDFEVDRELSSISYVVGEHVKRVDYFRVRVRGELVLGALPNRTHERRWVSFDVLGELPLVAESLRAVFSML